MVLPLDYQSADTSDRKEDSGTVSLRSGIISCAGFAIVFGMDFLAARYFSSGWFVYGLATIAAALGLTAVAFIGLLAGLMGVLIEGAPPRAIGGTILNLIALVPAILTMSSIWIGWPP